MIIRPNGYAIWEKMQQALDGMFKETGHQNAVLSRCSSLKAFYRRKRSTSKGSLPKSPVVTHGGGEKLEEPLIVRPDFRNHHLENVSATGFSRIAIFRC
jgi:prolyl-tRNA synthetase